jgi:hypothetical protein
MQVIVRKVIAFRWPSRGIRLIDNVSRTEKDKISQRQYFVYIFVFFFAITGIALLVISIASGDSVIRSSAMDLFKLWLGALISIVSIMCTYYFRDDD